VDYCPPLLLYLIVLNLIKMLLFLVPFYFILFFGWLIYAGLIKKNLKDHKQVALVGSVFSVVWIVLAALSIYS